mmetsp:Transcript_13930/g.35982  ORF Transcript_13930/g.35982 Transcript_13930/m.35982 type:complete len:329 (+) Transcript_13930:244-1230(+)
MSAATTMAGTVALNGARDWGVAIAIALRKPRIARRPARPSTAAGTARTPTSSIKITSSSSGRTSCLQMITTWSSLRARRSACRPAGGRRGIAVATAGVATTATTTAWTSTASMTTRTALWAATRTTPGTSPPATSALTCFRMLADLSCGSTWKTPRRAASTSVSGELMVRAMTTLMAMTTPARAGSVVTAAAAATATTTTAASDLTMPRPKMTATTISTRRTQCCTCATASSTCLSTRSSSSSAAMPPMCPSLGWRLPWQRSLECPPHRRRRFKWSTSPSLYARRPTQLTMRRTMRPRSLSQLSLWWCGPQTQSPSMIAWMPFWRRVR